MGFDRKTENKYSVQCLSFKRKKLKSKRACLRFLLSPSHIYKVTTKSNKYYLGDYKRGPRRYKNELFNILGHKCKRCGMTDKRILTFDHINNDGNKDRGSRENSTRFDYYIAHPIFAISRLQVLCYNCNILKTYTEGHNIKQVNDVEFHF